MKKCLLKNSRVLDLYAGAGTIGLLLHAEAKSVHAVEIGEGAVASALLNAKINGLEHYSAECLPAESIDASIISGEDALVLDPPRVGLHPKLISAILDKKPKQILYLSCNPETQARDYAHLHETYKIDLIHGFDFYPETPHVESLLILSLRDK